MNNCKSILSTTPEVRAILDGHKTQTRRVVKPQPEYNIPLGFCLDSTDKASIGKFGFGLCEHGGRVKYYKPPCQPGDILWVRETWMPCASIESWVTGIDVYAYKADYADEALREAKQCGIGWHPSIHMPREAARIFLRVTDVRVERVQEISETDARAEGILTAHSRLGLDPLTHADMQKHNMPYEKLEYMHLWNTLYTKRGYGWDANPWVWAISFERTGKPEGWPT